MKKIGLVGVGWMGHGIALNLLRKGHDLCFLEHPGNQPTQELVKLGGRPERTAIAVGQSSEIVIVCVTGAPQVEAVLTASDGILAAVKRGTVIVDCSTSLPSSSVRMAVAASEVGARFMDAAMTRTPKEAAEGRLNLLVGGEADLVAEVRPVLECFAENITHAGPVGSGHRTKLLHNFVSMSMVTLLGEAFACASKAGMPPEILLDVLAKGGGGGIALERMKPYVLAGDPGGLRFSIGNAQKDVGYYSTMSQELGAHSTVANAVLRTLDTVVEAGHAQSFMPELARLLAEDAQKVTS